MKLNIAIVDDLESDRKLIKEYIDKYFSNRRNKPAKVGNYHNAEDFLKAYRNGEYQIIFVDICMDGMNGLELANRVRNADKDICIIFMSATQDFVFRSFSAVPEGYLCKPVEYAAFTEVMDRTLNKLFADENYLNIKLHHAKTDISISDIAAVLTKIHSIEIRLITGEVLKSNMPFSDILTILENKPIFLECSRGIINMDYAVQIKDDTIIMHDGTIYPICKQTRKETLAKFTKYIASKMRTRLEKRIAVLCELNE